jgi:hypothetical protein
VKSQPPNIPIYVAWTREDGWEWDTRPFTVRTGFQEDGSYEGVQAQPVMYAPIPAKEEG